MAKEYWLPFDEAAACNNILLFYFIIKKTDFEKHAAPSSKRSIMFSDSHCRRDAGLTGLLDEITNSSEEGV